MSSPPSSTETAPPSSPTPFPDVPFPDIILQSSGGVEYHMCKRTLAQASPVFADMLSLPQPHSTSAAADEKRDGVSVIALTEPAADLDILLQYCIPQISPTLDDLSTVARLLEGARKYQVDRATKAARTALVCFAQNEPVKAYTVASRYSLEDEVRAAAQCCLRILLESLITASIDDLDGITLQAFRNLLIVARARPIECCGSKIVTIVTSSLPERIVSETEKWIHWKSWNIFIATPAARPAVGRQSSKSRISSVFGLQIALAFHPNN